MRGPISFRGTAGIVIVALTMALALAVCSSRGEALSALDMSGSPIDVSDSSVNVMLVTGSNVRGNVKRASAFPSQVEETFVAAFQTGGESAVVSVEGEPRLFPMEVVQSSAASPDIHMEENEVIVRFALGSICQDGFAADSLSLTPEGKVPSEANAGDTQRGQACGSKPLNSVASLRTSSGWWWYS